MDIIKTITDWIYVYQSEIYINLVAGLLASFIVLTFQTLVRTVSLILASIFTIKFRLFQVWQIKKPQRIFVVSGAIGFQVPVEVQTAILAGPDADAASTVIATLGLLYPDVEIQHVYSSTFPLESYKENLVVIGGPINNSCTAIFMEHIKDKAFYNAEFELVLGESKFTTQYDGDRAEKDFGSVIRMQNPFNHSKDVIIVSGCDTHGVLAAATLISSRNEANRARNNLRKALGIKTYFQPQDYIAVVECVVLGNDIGHIITKEVLKIDRHNGV
jgi:hypothetical protein